MEGYLKNRKNIFPASDWFDLNFLGGFLSSDNDSKRFLNEQKHKIGKEKLSSRVLNHWYEVGILEDDRPDGKGWKKFSITELVWIQIIIKLRGFGLDLTRIKKVKEEIDVYNTKDNISKCPLLDFHIIWALNTPDPVKLIVFESGEASINRQIEIDMANQFGRITEDYISIDINKLVEKFFKKKKFSTDYLGYSDIPKSPIVREIEKTLSEDDIECVTVKVGGENYLIDKEYLKKSDADAKAIIGMLNHAENKHVIHNGQSVWHVKLKKKIQKKG
jgi:DNA-binding transcriptional MerR regulator